MYMFRSTRSFFFFSLIMLAAKLWLVRAHPVMATITPHDDLLFIRQANDMLSGNWLGEYNQLTLIKGQFYPIFIALCYWLNIPLLAAQQLLYGLASFLAIWAVYPFVKHKWPLFLLLLVLLLNPFSFNYPAVGRLFRESVYSSLGLLTFSCLIGMLLRIEWSWKNTAAWSIFTGLSLSAFWNTREESIWIIPSLFMLLAVGFFHLRGLPRAKATAHAGFFILPLVILLAVNYSLKSKNKYSYGVPATIEIETPEFKSAYGGLLRIKSDKWQQFYPVVKDVREKVYAISPAFSEVRPFLEGTLGQNWQNLAGSNDIPAAFFIWAFRDSVAAAGYYKDGPSTLQFYQRIGEEIDQACDMKKLDCNPRLTSLVPAWHSEYNPLLLPTYFSVLKRIISFEGSNATIKGLRSQGSSEIMEMYERVTREKVLSSEIEKLRNQEPRYHSHLIKEKTKILSDIGKIYKWIIPPLFCLAFIAFVINLFRSIFNKELRLFTVVGAAALSGILAIAFILTLLTITSYSEIARAMHTSYPMVLLFIVSVVIDLLLKPLPFPSVSQVKMVSGEGCNQVYL